MAKRNIPKSATLNKDTIEQVLENESEEIRCFYQAISPIIKNWDVPIVGDGYGESDEELNYYYSYTDIFCVIKSIKTFMTKTCDMDKAIATIRSNISSEMAREGVEELLNAMGCGVPGSKYFKLQLFVNNTIQDLCEKYMPGWFYGTRWQNDKKYYVNIVHDVKSVFRVLDLARYGKYDSTRITINGNIVFDEKMMKIMIAKKMLQSYTSNWFGKYDDAMSDDIYNPNAAEEIGKDADYCENETFRNYKFSLRKAESASVKPGEKQTVIIFVSYKGQKSFMLPKSKNSIDNVLRSLQKDNVKFHMVEDDAENYKDYKKQLFKDNGGYSWFVVNEHTEKKIKALVDKYTKDLK